MIFGAVPDNDDDDNERFFVSPSDGKSRASFNARNLVLRLFTRGLRITSAGGDDNNDGLFLSMATAGEGLLFVPATQHNG